MAVITSAGSGLWSVGANWIGGSVPANNDTVVIADGHVVEFDVDQSGFVDGIAGITITGTLKLTRTAGAYHMKIKAANTISGAGVFDCGTDVDTIPFAAKHTITGGDAWYIDGSGGLTTTVYATEPTYTYVKLSAAEAAGQTVLSVDTNVTGDIWQAGDTIRVDDIDKGQDTEERIIAAGGIAAGEITITAGLTKAKLAGALVLLITRNVKFIGIGSTGYVAQNFASGKLTVAGGEWTTANYRVFYACTDMTISGGTFSGNVRGLNSCAGASISGGTFSGNGDGLYSCTGASVSGGTFSGNTNGLYSCTGASVSGGTFSGNTNGLYSCTGASISGGTFSGNTYGLYSCTATIKGTTFTSNSYDIRETIFDGYGIEFTSTPPNYGYHGFAKEIYSYIDDYAGLGGYRAWTKGGITETQAVIYPTGYDESYNIILEDADNEGYFQREIVVGAGQSVNFDLRLRKDGAMTYLPRFQIFLKRLTDPFAGGTPEHTFTMTDSVDTWEDESYTYSNDGTEDETLVIRVLGKAASGNVYAAYTAEILNVDLTNVLANLATVDGIVDAIKTITDQFNFTVPNQVDANALTGGTSATEIRQEMDANSTKLSDILTDTGTDIPAKIDAVDAGVWTYASRTLTQSATEIIAAVSGSSITQIRGNTWDFDIADVTLDANKQQFAIKYTNLDTDAQSILLIDTATGLLYVNGAVATDATKASLSYAGTTLTVTVDASITAQLPTGNYRYGIQSVTAAGVVAESYGGTFTITADTVRATA